MENNTVIKITDLIENFRQALVSMVPCIEKINLSWTGNETYDQWDHITSVLYENLVKFPVSWGLIEEQELKLEIPDYDMSYEDYSGFSFIALLPERHVESAYYVFHSFVTRKKAFDTVRIIKIDDNEKRSDGIFVEIPCVNSKFIFCYQKSEGNMDVYKEISIK